MLPKAPAIALLLSTAVALGQEAAPAPQVPVFSERVEVRVLDLDVDVTDSKGQPVTDLKREDFTVKIGGKAVDGCYFSNHYSPDEQRPEVQAFVSAYKAKYNGKVPDAMAIIGYDSLKVLCDAITRAKSTDGKQVRDALAATKNYPGACGPITIDENRNARKNIVILKIENGAFKYVATVEPK